MLSTGFSPGQNQFLRAGNVGRAGITDNSN